MAEIIDLIKKFFGLKIESDKDIIDEGISATYKNDMNVEKFSFVNKYIIADVVSVYDGDTIHVVFEFLNGNPYKFSVRMYGYDSPEMKPPKNAENRDKIIEKAKFAKEEIEKKILGKKILLKCNQKEEKFGRILADVYKVSKKSKIPNNQRTTFIDKEIAEEIIKNSKYCEHINKYMIDNGYGKEYYGGKKDTSIDD